MQAVTHAALGLAFVVAAGGWGWAVLSVFGRVPSRDPDRLLGYPFAGLTLLALLGSILWITGGFRTELAWTLTLGGLVLALWGALAEGTVPAMEQFRAATDPGARRWALAAWGVATALVVPTLLAPDTTWDSCAHHLVIARDAARSGALPALPDSPWMAHPLSAHTWLGWGYLLTGVHRDVSGRVILTLAAALGVALATRRLGRVAHPRAGLVALVLVLANPLWLVQWGSAGVDLAVLTVGAAGLALLTLATEERRWRALGLVALGVAAASRHWGMASTHRDLLDALPWQYAGALLLALGWDRWCAHSLLRRHVLRALLIILWLPIVQPIALDSAGKLPVITGQETTLQYWVRSDPAAPVLRVANDFMTPDDRLFVAGERVILLDATREQIVYTGGARAVGADSAAALVEAWNRWGITYVLLCNDTGAWDPAVRKEWLLDDAPALRDWKLVAEHGGARLYNRPVPARDLYDTAKPAATTSQP